MNKAAPRISSVDLPEVIIPDIEKTRTVLRKYGCREVYFCTSRTSHGNRNKTILDFGVKGLEPDVFYRAYGELCFELDHEVRLSDFTAHKRRFDFLIQEGECSLLV